jgi:hypothetical protein
MWHYYCIDSYGFEGGNMSGLRYRLVGLVWLCLFGCSVRLFVSGSGLYENILINFKRDVNENARCYEIVSKGLLLNALANY